MSFIINHSELLNTNSPSLMNDELVPSNDALLDSAFYETVMSYVKSNEDEDGNYDYSDISNLGMIYLYVHQRGRKRSKTTKADYIRELIRFLRYASSLGKLDIRELTRSEVETYQMHMESRYPKTTTRAKKIGIVRSFLEWIYEEDYIPKNLTRGLIPVRINKDEIPEREIDEQDFHKAIVYFNDHPKVKALLMILGTTGLRLNEVIAPKWGSLSFDSQRKRYYLRTKTKRGKIRYANIKDYVLDELCEYRKRLGLNTRIDPKDETPFYPNRFGRHYSLSSLSSSLSKHMAEAGLSTIQLQRVTPHFIRHYFAQAAFSAGAPLGHIAETLGHTAERTTKENYLRNALKKEHDVSEYVDIVLPDR